MELNVSRLFFIVISANLRKYTQSLAYYDFTLFYILFH